MGEAVEDVPTGAAEPPSVVVDVDCVTAVGPVGAGNGVSPLDCEVSTLVILVIEVSKVAELKEAVVILDTSEDGLAESLLALFEVADETLPEPEVGLALLAEGAVEPEAVFEREDELRSDVTYVDVLESEEEDRELDVVTLEEGLLAVVVAIVVELTTVGVVLPPIALVAYEPAAIRTFGVAKQPNEVPVTSVNESS